MATLPYDANSEWPIDGPAIPLKKGIAMVRIAARERHYVWGAVNPAIVMQQRLAVQAWDNKWQKQQSELKTEAAKRFQIRAQGWKALIGVLVGGPLILLLIEHFLLG